VAPGRRAVASMAGLAAVAAAAAAVGCGTGRRHVVAQGPELTVYSSLPLDAANGARAQDVADAERLALEQAGGRAGRFRVALTNLDDADPTRRSWDPGRTQLDGRRAAGDPATIAYLGELDPGASAISLPLTNAAGILQVSPGDSLVGLTRRAGAAPGEPERYYPAGSRTFVRLVPTDDAQAEALLGYMGALRVRRMLLIDDEGAAGHALAQRMSRTAAQHGIDAVDVREIAPGSTDFTGLAGDVARSGADAVCFAGSTVSGAPALFAALAAADPTLRLFGSSGVADSVFAAALDPRAARRTVVVSPVSAPAGTVGVPGRAALARFQDEFHRRYGHDPDPAAALGYEAMGLVLSAISDAGVHGNDRAAVVRAALSAQRDGTVVGAYHFDPGGDTSSTSFTGWRVIDGHLAYDRTLPAAIARS